MRDPADHRRPARRRLEGQREHGRGADGRAGPGRPAQEEAPVRDPAGQGPLARRGLVKRDFPAEKINTKWYGDGTEIKTGQGKLYLASVLDMARGRELGFAVDEHQDAAVAYGALTIPVAVRGGQVPGVIFTLSRL